MKASHPLITPILRQPHTDAEGAEDGAETRMRQALGKLGTAKPGKPDASRRTTHQATPGAGRHRFRQDGEVPVVRLSLGNGSRGMERQPQAPAERIGAGAGRGQADKGSVDNTRQVQELTEQLRATQTRLGHAELVASEATRAAQIRQEEAAGLRQALDTAEASLAQLRAELAASEQTRERSRPATRHLPQEAEDQGDTATRRKVGRPLGSTNRIREHVPGSEPEPVKWWTGN